MSLFDLQDVCIAIGSIETLDLPMVVDQIGIYGLKGPYCTLTTTNRFLQALSVIPRGSWDDVARRFTMIRWADHNVQFWKLNRWSDLIGDRSYDEVTVVGMNRMFTPLKTAASISQKVAAAARRAPPPPPVFAGKFVSGQFDEENPFVLISSVLLVQADKGVSFLVMDRIGDIYRSLPRRADVIVTTVGARHKCQQGNRLNIL
ncbi:hypothetical protein F511_25320 [Dorcoceras hygrometricum]|uniref:Uncharacterized protein n=1 Tax=Dorcoceras hygrometricum TaxID=472368 RepID=A0A2Z7CY48_9LAMI|nr:hypothetical protein F511_25320 [Dorcoceras hygrometricum]